MEVQLSHGRPSVKVPCICHCLRPTGHETLPERRKVEPSWNPTTEAQRQGRNTEKQEEENCAPRGQHLAPGLFPERSSLCAPLFQCLCV